MVNDVNPRKFFSKGWDLEMLLGGWMEHYTRGGALGSQMPQESHSRGPMVH